MSTVVVHTTPQTIASRLAWAVVFCVAVNLGAVFLGFAPPIVAMTQTLGEVFPPFVHGIQEAIGIIRAAAAK